MSTYLLIVVLTFGSTQTVQISDEPSAQSCFSMAKTLMKVETTSTKDIYCVRKESQVM